MKAFGLFVLLGLVLIAVGAKGEVCSEDQVDQNQIMKAINGDNVEDFKRLIQKDNKDCEIKDTYGKNDVYYRTVLFKAVKANSKDIVTYLLKDLKADANIGEVYDGKLINTPLTEAAAGYKPLKDMVKLLLEEGHADVAKANVHGESPFTRTIDMMFGDSGFDTYLKNLDYLLKKGADVNQRLSRHFDATALLMAADVSWLKDTDEVYKWGSRYIKMAKTLMKNKADASLKDADGKTACDLTKDNAWLWEDREMKRRLKMFRRKSMAEILQCNN